MLPVEQQAWYAGQLGLERAKDRLRNLPVGTFMVRARGQPNQYALDIITQVA